MPANGLENRLRLFVLHARRRRPSEWGDWGERARLAVIGCHPQRQRTPMDESELERTSADDRKRF
jgi:hypothetical protein